MDRSQLYNDAEEAQRLLLDGRQSTIWTAIPCLVTKVDLTAMTIEAQPTIQGAVEDENGKIQYVNLPLLVDVPIVFPSAGGFTITLPIKANDEVLVIFASRCIDAWWQSGGIQKPMEARMHDLSDGFAIPGPKSQPNKISGISSTGAQIRNDAGTTYVEIAADGKIKLVSPSEIDITAPLTKVSGGLAIGGVVTKLGGGTLSMNTDIALTGAMVASGEITSGVIPLSTHRHPQTGGADTDGPIP